MKTNNLFLIAILFSSLLFCSSVYGFGVSAPYWNDNPLNMSPGDTKTIQFMLQNDLGSDDIRVMGAVTEGSDIASILGDTFSVKAGIKTPVQVKIEIPLNYTIGKSSRVVLMFTTIAATAGSFGLGSGIEQNFPVNIVSKTPVEGGKSYLWLYILIGIVVLLAIIILVIYLKKKQEN